jgi:hypothetical protein
MVVFANFFIFLSGSFFCWELKFSSSRRSSMGAILVKSKVNVGWKRDNNQSRTFKFKKSQRLPTQTEHLVLLTTIYHTHHRHVRLKQYYRSAHFWLLPYFSQIFHCFWRDWKPSSRRRFYFRESDFPRPKRSNSNSAVHKRTALQKSKPDENKTECCNSF